MKLLIREYFVGGKNACNFGILAIILPLSQIVKKSKVVKIIYTFPGILFSFPLYQ